MPLVVVSLSLTTDGISLLNCDPFLLWTDGDGGFFYLGWCQRGISGAAPLRSTTGINCCNPKLPSFSGNSLNEADKPID